MIDKSGASTASIAAINRMLRRFGCAIEIEMVRVKYLNIKPGVPPVRTSRRGVEQPSRGLQANPCLVTGHRTIKKGIRLMLGFKSFVSASATLEGIEVANMIRKGQLTAYSGASGHSFRQHPATYSGVSGHL